MADVRHAVAVLDRIFGGVDATLRVRLWDGSEHGIGTGPPAFTLVVRDPATFRQVFAGTRTRPLAEAFVENRVDVEGDLFAALRLAADLEDRRLCFRDRVAIGWALARI